MKTIKHEDICNDVIIAKYLTKFDSTMETADGAVDVSAVFTDAFHEYVKDWQTKHKLKTDGIIGTATWTAIASEAPVCSTKKGTKQAIKCVQLIVGTTADGVFGPKTKAAVVAYQASRGLSADGIVGEKTWTAMLIGEYTVSAGNSFKQPVDYKQGDSRWGKVVYTSCGNKKQTIANSGCGPTSMADIVATFKDAKVTPVQMCELALKWGYRTSNSGTAWGFFKRIADHYGFSKFVQTSSLETMKNCLASGGYVVCSMGPGYWTKGGHFICAWKFDSTYIYCNDPASSSRTRQKQSEFLKERKQFFCFWK